MELPRLDRVPSVATAMTPFPYSVAPTASITEAEELMETHDIHHVPVEDASGLVGIVTAADISLLVDTSLPLAERTRIPVQRVCSTDPYVVDLHESLGVVAAQMASRGVHSALVVREGKLAGIFTSSDACRVLATILGEAAAPKGPNEVA